MGNEIFRKKSLEKIQSPESLNDYLRVSNPGMWMLLAAIVALLIGACVWGIFGQVTTSATTVLDVQDGVITCYVDDEYQERLVEGQKVTVEGREGTVLEVLNDATDGIRAIVHLDEPLDDGHYVGEITLESERPLSFVLN